MEFWRLRLIRKRGTRGETIEFYPPARNQTMKLSLDSDGSRRMPAINAGSFKPLQKFVKSNFAQVAPLKGGLTLQQKKYLIGALMALNLGLIPTVRVVVG